MSELKPCPFCGHPGEFQVDTIGGTVLVRGVEEPWGYAQCSNPRCGLGFLDYRPLAIAQWNGRVDKAEELRDSEKLGKYLARELMMVGDEFGKECHRIQFMVGGYRNEVPAAGMCEVALASFFTEKLEAIREPGDESNQEGLR